MAITRKDDGTVILRTAITLKPGRDDNLIDLVLTADNLAASIREAMRNGVVAETEFIPDDDQDFDFDFGREL